MANNWEDNEGNSWQTIAAVNIGDPTRASWANDVQEDLPFAANTRAGLLRGYDDDNTQGSAQSAARKAGDSSGFLFNVHGCLKDDEYRPLLSKEELTGGFPGSMDMRYRMLYMLGEFSGPHDSKTTAQTYLPGGTQDDWYKEKLANGSGALTVLSTYTSAGSDDAGGGFAGDHTATLGVSDAGLIIFAGASAIGAAPIADGCATGDLIIFNDYPGANQWLTYHFMILVGPAWGAV